MERKIKDFIHAGVVSQWDAATENGVIVRADGHLCVFTGKIFDRSIKLGSHWVEPQIGEKVIITYNDDYEVIAIFNSISIPQGYIKG